jgi:hypothetical protein
MSDHEFEKQVQRKMDEFKLRPSDAVWTAVEKNIRQTRPRRRFGFWLPVGIAIIATTGYLLFSGGLNLDKTESIAQSKPVQEYSTSKNNTLSETNSTRNDNRGEEEQGAIQQPVTPENRADDAPVSNQPPVQEQVAKTNAVTDARIDRPHQTGNRHETNNRQQQTKRNNIRPEQLSTETITRPRANSFSNKPNIISTNNDAHNTLLTAMPQLAPFSLDAIATSKAAPAPLNKNKAFTMPQNTAVTPPIERKRGPQWVFGAQTNAGISRITQSNLLQVNGWLGSTEKSLAEDLSRRSTENMLSSPGISYNSFINAVPLPPKKPAVIRQGLSYSAGLYAQRPLSKRLRLTVGLNYSYMSAHTDIGKLVDRPTIVNMGTASASVVSRYYTSYDALVSTGGLNTQWQGVADSMVLHKYTYRFHNIEIPVTINWQINKGRNLPPFVLDAGFSVSKLLSADGLHYDGTKGIYYQNDKLFNKTFVNALLGINVGLLQNSKTPVWIGPSLRYSLTGLLDKSVSSGQFMWSAGVNARIQLGRF